MILQFLASPLGEWIRLWYWDVALVMLVLGVVSIGGIGSYRYCRALDSYLRGEIRRTQYIGIIADLRYSYPGWAVMFVFADFMWPIAMILLLTWSSWRMIIIVGNFLKNRVHVWIVNKNLSFALTSDDEEVRALAAKYGRASRRGKKKKSDD